MGISNSPELFEQEMNYLFNGFEFICAYIDKTFILTNETGKITYRSWNEP